MKNNESLSQSLGFLVWYQVFSHMDKTQQDSIVSIIQEICEYVEKEINSNGGIVGRKIKVHFLVVQENEGEAREKLENYLKNNPDILFVPQAPTFYKKNSKGVEEELIKKFKDKPYIIFDAFDMFSGNYSSNFFSTNRDYVTPNNRLKVIEKLFSPKNIFIFSLNDDELSYLNKSHDLNCNLKQINIEKLEKNNNVEFKNIDELKKCSENDIIFASKFYRKDKISFISEFVESETKAKLILASLDPRELKIITDRNLEKFSEKDIYFFDDENYHIFLKLKDIFYNLNSRVKSSEQKYINWLFGIDLEIPYLVEYLFKKNNVHSVKDKTEFFNLCKKFINSLSAKSDIFLGKSCNYSFSDNLNILKGNSVLKVQFDKANNESLFFLHDKQYKNFGNAPTIVDVNYVNIDIIRIHNISLDNNEFSSEFFFDITSRNDSPIDFIKFNNLSSKNYHYDYVLTNKTSLPNSEFSTFRYLIRANLSFNGLASRYPFDEQIIFISFAIINEKKYGILQPFQENEIDTDFRIDGWTMVETRFGMLRTKNRINMGPNKLPKMEIEEELRMGWRIKRSSTMTIIKLGIPLVFLTTLVYYTLFIPFENVDRSIGILTTSFLSGIALYFSSEKPQPLNMTIIDYIFAIYYVVTGLVTLGVTVFAFLPDYYEIYMLVAKIFIPSAILISIFVIRTKVMSQKHLLKMLPKKIFD